MNLSKVLTPGVKKRIGQVMIHFNKLEPKVQTQLLAKIADTVSMFQGVEAVAFNKDLLEETIQ